jgi:hypothetical protein
MVGCDIDNFYITRLVEPTIIIILKKKKKEKTSQLEIYFKKVMISHKSELQEPNKNAFFASFS